MKILTITRMDNDGKKPTVFARVIKDGNLKSSLHYGLHTKCGIANDELDGYLEGAVKALNEDGYGWWDADILIEITDVEGAA